MREWFLFGEPASVSVIGVTWLGGGNCALKFEKQSD
jgi:hypothetical protein